jgi:hypothetical protein
MPCRATSELLSRLSKSTEKGSFTVIDRGAGGIDALRSALDAECIWYGLVKFVVGSGSFARTKYIFFHWNGPDCSAVKRGRANAAKSKALEAVGAIHSEMVVIELQQCTTDFFFEKLEKVFVSDDGDASFSISAMKEDYERSAIDARMEEITKGAADAPPRPTAMEMPHPPSAERCIEAVRLPLGPFNWVLLHPLKKGETTPVVHNAGGGSVRQMMAWLNDTDDKVLYGLIRMGFGSGGFRRTKWIFLMWTGEKMNQVKRGKAMEVEGAMKNLLRPFNLDFKGTNKVEYGLKKIIDRVQKSVVVDGKTGTEEVDVYTIDAFMEALREEAMANMDFFDEEMERGDDAEEAAAAKKKVVLPLDATIEMVRNDANNIDWALIAPEGQHRDSMRNRIKKATPEEMAAAAAEVAVAEAAAAAAAAAAESGNREKGVGAADILEQEAVAEEEEVEEEKGGEEEGPTSPPPTPPPPPEDEESREQAENRALMEAMEGAADALYDSDEDGEVIFDSDED